MIYFDKKTIPLEVLFNFVSFLMSSKDVLTRWITLVWSPLEFCFSLRWSVDRSKRYSMFFVLHVLKIAKKPINNSFKYISIGYHVSKVPLQEMVKVESDFQSWSQYFHAPFIALFGHISLPNIFITIPTSAPIFLLIYNQIILKYQF